MPWMTEPEPRNRQALNSACVSRWKAPAHQAPTPTPMNMKPSCDTVEYASTFLMSYWNRPIDAANSAVITPTSATTVIAPGVSTNRKLRRAIMYTPAVTMVAAWISADTGVGPAMASGSQTYSGSWADLPQAPMNRPRQTRNRMGIPQIFFLARCSASGRRPPPSVIDSWPRSSLNDMVGPTTTETCSAAPPWACASSLSFSVGWCAAFAGSIQVAVTPLRVKPSTAVNSPACGSTEADAASVTASLGPRVSSMYWPFCQ